MPFPDGVQLATLTFSNPITFLGTAATRTEITVQPTTSAVWSATGQPIDSFPQVIAPAPGAAGEIQAPVVDQDGFTDYAGNQIKGWAYVVTRQTWFGNASTGPVRKAWVPVIGQDPIDFDNLPGGAAGPISSFSPVPVTSVGGLVGDISPEDLADRFADLGINTGMVGPQGPQGIKGDTGLTGPQGIQGIQGSQGIKGEPGDLVGTAGPANVAGAVDLTVAAFPSTRLWNLTGNVVVTLPAPSAEESATITLVLTQDATGGRTVTWPASVKWPEGIAQQPAAGTGTVTVFHLLWTGIAWLGILGGKAFA